MRIQRQTKAAAPVARSGSRRRNPPRVYHNDRNRPTDRSNIPSIVKAPLLSPGTYDAETLLRQRARSLSIGSAEEEEAAWVASGGQQARLSTLSKHVASPDSDYFGRAPRVGVEGALGLADTDVDESGTESGRESPVQRFAKGARRRGLSGGLNFTPVSPDRPYPPASPAGHQQQHSASSATAPASVDNEASYSASVVSLSSGSSSSSSTNGDRFLAVDNKPPGKSSDADASSLSNMSSSWIGVDAEAEAVLDGVPAAAPAVDPVHAAAAAGLEPEAAH